MILSAYQIGLHLTTGPPTSAESNMPSVGMPRYPRCDMLWREYGENMDCTVLADAGENREVLSLV